MKAQMSGAVLAIALLLPGAAPAQQLGAARGRAPYTSPLPRRPAVHRPAPPAPAPGADLFRARPWTYQPHFDRVPRGRFRPHRFFPRGFAHVAPVYSPPLAWVPPTAGPQRREEPARIVDARPETAVRPPQPYVPGPPGPARTLYVIPGCYAGDVPPQAGHLPDGCDAADLRTIAPR